MRHPVRRVLGRGRSLAAARDAYPLCLPELPSYAAEIEEARIAAGLQLPDVAEDLHLARDLDAEAASMARDKERLARKMRRFAKLERAFTELQRIKAELLASLQVRSTRR